MSSTRTTQRDRVLSALENGPVCAMVWVRTQPPILRYAARINELRDEGMKIATEPCDRPGHVHDARIVQYRLLHPGQLELLG